MRNLKYLGPAAIACAAVLWSFDGLLRQYLSEIPSLMVVLLEHFFGAVLLTPLLLKSWKEVKHSPTVLGFPFSGFHFLEAFLALFSIQKH